ncbi:MAG: UDP-N-acetylglucosamine--N-acetylmuramyl-(pentapeptide) pyrophosphoryl-undecaprenol N-acetylglucosamine transferase [Verrucomicrobia bacterium]|nr:UDP-N-acetylglucosamine--N-acetylmuramyl-(pentapeptide) pyrophosphoryl-undecaprenol N-acetylglucosamine transferase [Verrucomicrobiota bacterium]
MNSPETKPLVAVACGGTGGHLFPGMAVAEKILEHDCAVMLLISPKEVDQQAVRAVSGMDVVTLPAVALASGGYLGFLRGFWRSYLLAKKLFRARAPKAVLAMGGFTSAPPVFAAKHFHAATFLHEANTIPGRANRLLAPWVDAAFVYFPETALRLRNSQVTIAGMPVRPQFHSMDAAACRMALGLSAEKPTLLVMGGSQGARGINDLVIDTLPLLAVRFPDAQFLHLTGPSDAEKVRRAYAAQKLKASVHPFLTEMELALGAATAVVSRAGASSLAEFAAMALPAILIPYPAAADNHQFHNARTFVETGAARMLWQRTATPELLAKLIAQLLGDEREREHLRAALTQRHVPDAAGKIAGRILQAIGLQPLVRANEAAANEEPLPNFSIRGMKREILSAP